MTKAFLDPNYFIKRRFTRKHWGRYCQSRKRSWLSI